MSTLINRVKDHLSDNRGKYGAAAGAGAGAGAMYGAPKIDSPLINQAGYNILAKGQNLALDAAEKIDPRAVTKLNDLGMHKIRPEDIDASNALYNSGITKYINPTPMSMVNASEQSTDTYNKAMALKAEARDTLANAKDQGLGYIDQGVNYLKGLNPFNESTITIPIKSLLLEGNLPETIVAALFENGYVGPWDQHNAAKIQYLTDRDAAMSQIYQNNKGHYFVNPLVSGPINHLGTKFSKAYNGVIYDTLKGKNAPTINGPVVNVDTSGGAWNADMDSAYVSGLNYEKAIGDIRQQNPYQYTLNPFVPGNIRETLTNVSNRTNGLTRGLLSPFGKAGSTIKQ